MSLFKRKHSKADLHPPPATTPAPAATPAVAPSSTPHRGQAYGNVGMGGNNNPRRMTSNPQLKSSTQASYPAHSSQSPQLNQHLPGQADTHAGHMGMSMPHPQLGYRSNPQSPTPSANGSAAPGGYGGSPHLGMSPPPIHSAAPASVQASAQPHQGHFQHQAPHSNHPQGQSQELGQGQVQSRPHPAPNPLSYPWQIRPLRLYSSGQNIPASPFPRYGLSVPCFPSHSGHMLVFGGLVNEKVRNDLWSIDIRDLSVMYVKTKGDAPPPRVGHASVIMDRIMVVWGGDTKVDVTDEQDEGLYILDLRSQEWTKVPISKGPVGRYGHAACMVENRFYVFGGQADGMFMNDMWMYDIKQLSGTATVHTWEQVSYTTPPPPRRTGHVLVAASSGKLYLFGGTDGNYHYNDTWCFDPSTGAWAELSCIGFIPLPREGHAAAIVDDTIYIFGGRDVKGKDLGDLAAFRLSNQRWFMFQNMGPSPAARSGHAMVSAHGKIFVVGGEANQVPLEPGERDDPQKIHVLDTSKIKYPHDAKNKTPMTDQADSRGTQDTPQPGQQQGQTQGRLPQSASTEGLNTRAGTSSPSSERGPSTQHVLTQNQPPTVDTQVSQQPQAQVPQPPLQSPRNVGPVLITKPNGPPPQRPRREGDEEYREAMSPTKLHYSSQASDQAQSPVQPSLPSRVTSPAHISPTSPKNHPKMFHSSVNGTRSPSPRLRNADGPSSERERAPPPPDAFYYGRRSPTANGFRQSASSRPSSFGPSNDLMKELRAKENEAEEGKRRETALKIILNRAIKQGFLLGDEEQKPSGGDKEGQADDNKQNDDLVGRLTDALVRLKKEKAEMQNDLVAQIRAASARSAEADHLRRGALQETAFYRAKIAALETNSPLDLKRVEKERINELEKQINILANENAQLSKELEWEKEGREQANCLRSSATQREAETLKRAEEAEEAQREALEELERMRDHFLTYEQSAREHTEQLITLSSRVQQREAERDQLRSQLDEAIATRDQNVQLVNEVQAAITSAGLMASEMEAMYAKESGKVQQLEKELAECRVELESRTRNAELAAERLKEIENAYAKSREEADALRAVTTSRLGEILDSHKEMRADETRVTKGHQEQLQALEEEGKSLRKMLKEAGQRVDAAESGVNQHRTKMRDMGSKVQALRSELRTSQTKLLSAQAEAARYKQLHSTRDEELKEKETAVTDVETRCTMLRNLLADHGIAVNDSDLDDIKTPSTRELEGKLREQARVNEAAQREIQDLRTRCEEAEVKVESLGKLVERIKDARSPTMRSPTPTDGEISRVSELEKKLIDMEKEHRDKVAGLETDYQTAVRYVKGTEKMLKRMKDELNRQKATNTAIQTELDHIRGRSIISGRSTPSSSSVVESDVQRRFNVLQIQHQKLQEDFSASQDVLSARNREVDLLRMRLDEAERDMESLRDDLAQAQDRIQTLLDVKGGSDDEDDGSLEATMAFDKFSQELKQWERSRSPGEGTFEEKSSEEGMTMPSQSAGYQARVVTQSSKAHSPSNSEYSGDWVQ
ncbi:hypothetical protein C351_02711 [Cryptococcus neoformans c8]|nr:hypothetical protein C353_02989 [Cryptococcus neoformans var. grubii AD1-83a]OXG60713.1 hypothetical protein C354_02926 [Cryptococcus neoformans var. grubii MW-RSA1955]OXG64200.1 hypothetical protein C351_02711 [Cryptococcus neoformans var. grubii c8]OXG65598.1 hypothetical protein C352_02936 [Cryptococcus neoformans var. grubii CHC193]OXH12011.1 hypothetical protein C369_02962 [Cryptococcus neoformans var. grubii A5-35-17]OXH13183.1 hypothetical protein C370_02981 [Cryptococcus neoformans 